jgi:hypothetical protein
MFVGAGERPPNGRASNTLLWNAACQGAVELVVETGASVGQETHVMESDSKRHPQEHTKAGTSSSTLTKVHSLCQRCYGY